MDAEADDDAATMRFDHGEVYASADPAAYRCDAECAAARNAALLISDAVHARRYGSVRGVYWRGCGPATRRSRRTCTPPTASP
jgi:hypothetical protein